VLTTIIFSIFFHFRSSVYDRVISLITSFQCFRCYTQTHRSTGSAQLERLQPNQVAHRYRNVAAVRQRSDQPGRRTTGVMRLGVVVAISPTAVQLSVVRRRFRQRTLAESARHLVAGPCRQPAAVDRRIVDLFDVEPIDHHREPRRGKSPSSGHATVRRQWPPSAADPNRKLPR